MQEPRLDEKPCCAVCLDDLRADLAALPCGHVFHQRCASRALARFSKCPICRTTTLAKQAVRLFYSTESLSSPNASDQTSPSLAPAAPPPASTANATPAHVTLSGRFSELQLSVSRLTANQRRISSHSFRLQAENARVRQENARVLEQLGALRAKHDALVKEIGVWKRIATSTYAQLQTLIYETSEANRSLLASMRELTHELLVLSRCASCESVVHSSSAHLHEFCQAVETKASATAKHKSPHTQQLACCSVKRASRALRGFCARHSSVSPPPQQQ